MLIFNQFIHHFLSINPKDTVKTEKLRNFQMRLLRDVGFTDTYVNMLNSLTLEINYWSHFHATNEHLRTMRSTAS